MTKLQHVIKISRIFFFLLWLISFALFSAFFFLFLFWLFKHFYGGSSAQNALRNAFLI